MRPVGGDVAPGEIEIIAQIGNRIVGTVTVARKSANFYYATALYVDPAHRRQGIGRKLMAAAEEHARAHNAQIRVEVGEENWGARAFFGATGWRR